MNHFPHEHGNPGPDAATLPFPLSTDAKGYAAATLAVLPENTGEIERKLTAHRLCRRRRPWLCWLALACRFAKAGFDTYAFDVDQEKVDRLRKSESYLSHIPSSWVTECTSMLVTRHGM